MIEFYRTVAGKMLVDKTLPSIARSLADIAKALENNQKRRVATTPQKTRTGVLHQFTNDGKAIVECDGTKKVILVDADQVIFLD